MSCMVLQQTTIMSSEGSSSVMGMSSLSLNAKWGCSVYEGPGGGGYSHLDWWGCAAGSSKPMPISSNFSKSIGTHF